MRLFGSRRKAKRWAREAMKWGLIFTDAGMWDAVRDDVERAAHSVTDRVTRRYEGRLSREEEARVLAALRSGPDWFGRTTSLLAGLGIGLGVGLLFAPLSGREARAEIRGRAADIKYRIGDATSRAARFRSVPETVTGTDGD